MLVTGIARIIFPEQAHGSLVRNNGVITGSKLICQQFADPRYFWPRPSAIAYNPLPSGGSNLGPISNQLKKNVEDNRTAFITANGLTPETPVPLDMLFTSASGLDPDISPEAARLQITRIALQRRFTQAQKTALALLVERSIQRPQLGFLGEPRVGVLVLNLKLDKLDCK
jgi:K+-transporting ATPase ATPase C chain